MATAPEEGHSSSLVPPGALLRCDDFMWVVREVCVVREVWVRVRGTRMKHEGQDKTVQERQIVFRFGMMKCRAKQEGRVNQRGEQAEREFSLSMPEFKTRRSVAQHTKDFKLLFSKGKSLLSRGSRNSPISSDI
ncbi:hypothetical protein RRG08_019053 [Elysia crispata]|uniref:Uncharacterized protein n=1 Tax=Elysia crispata TaxID=231223 RepID=A0AAE1DST2_9GAST|nr:hypothetical protein RRG08_019053 [Elysia crispata]